ncbi:hypothetical protein RclHR1_00340038 [Rhizophagus clarus]|uniref:Uncharacterized protein n=1 Tax=Rhizophagus clarus TaxID=94130 RepID=A0A2Z6R9I1_9GLOM|nr:hypothetical protein RclHR1_00340038 [Rhizophagus clarus]GES87495.1 hypothetical protein GLOIN_2v1729203 [Rhizophagus clarus]
MPVSVSRKLLEEVNNNNNQAQSYASSHMSCFSSHSISSEPTFEGDHSLYRQPTFSYIPIHKRRRSTPFARSISLNSMSSNHSSSSLATTNFSSSPGSEVPSTPTSFCSSSSDQSIEYTSFPNLEKFSDECWTEIRVEKEDSICDIEMESYDEMFVAGVRFQYS